MNWWPLVRWFAPACASLLITVAWVAIIDLFGGSLNLIECIIIWSLSMACFAIFNKSS
jgi:hypothetical protein